MIWVKYQAVSLGFSSREYRLMTVGEIQDLATCRAIANGGLEEKIEFTGRFLPKLR